MRLRDIAITPSVNRRLSPAARPIVGRPTSYKCIQSPSNKVKRWSQALQTTDENSICITCSFACSKWISQFTVYLIYLWNHSPLCLCFDPQIGWKISKNSDFNQIIGGLRLSISWSAWWLSKSFNHPKKRFHFPFVFLILSDFEVSSSEAAETPCLTSVKLPQGFPLLLILLTRPMFTANAEGTSFAIKVWQINKTNVVVTHKWRGPKIARNVVFLAPAVSANQTSMHKDANHVICYKTMFAEQVSAKQILLWHKWREFEIARYVVFLPPAVGAV